MIRTTMSGPALLVSSLALGIAFVGDALAQQQAKPDASAELADIVVTATKRVSTVQDTPISLTAVTGADIQARGLADFTSLAQSVPGISMRTSGPGQTEFEMRGMASAGGNSPTVGFYLDDTPLTAPAAAQNGKVVIDPNLYDMDRVEVLRGPQGTLYGSGSMGGTIKIIPNAPNTEAFDTSAELIFSDTDGGGFNHGENAMVNLPFGGGTAALRIVGSESHDSGWINRVVIANGDFPLESGSPVLSTRGNVAAAPVAADYKDVNDEDLTSVRASLLWKPTDRLDITPSFFYQQIRQDGLSDIDSNPGTYTSYQPFNTPEPFSDQFNLGSVNVKYRFDAFDLTSTTSVWTRNETLMQDGTEEIQWALSSPGAIFPFYTSQGGLGPTVPASIENDKTKQTSEEVRLTSTGDSKFQWLAGYFYADFTSDWDSYVTQPGALPLFGTENDFTQLQPTKIIQNSFFGELSYQLTPQLKATAGLRRYSYDSSVTTTFSGWLSSTGGNNQATSNSGENDQGVNPKFDLSYEIDKNLLLYATIAKGFRPGGGNQPIPTSGPVGSGCEQDLQANHGTTSFVAPPPAFAPDSVWSYEVGEKAKVLDSRLTINSAIYFEKWNGVQQTIPLSCGFSYTDNSGDAQVKGGEIEVNALLVPDLILSANAGYAHAVFVVGSLEAGITAGTPVQDVPDWTSSVSLAYHHDIADNLALISRIENNYVAGHTDATFAINHLPSYDLTNLRAGVEGAHWSAVLFATNLFNVKALLTDAPAINVNAATFNRIAVSQPLTIGVDLNYRFGP